MSAPFTDAPAPRRIVHQAEAIAWLSARRPLIGASVITSLPDVSELPALDFAAWRDWFVEAATLVMTAIPEEGVAIFFQSDIRHAGAWVDKGALVSRAAERAGLVSLFHAVVCRRPPGSPTFGRASYAHLLGFARRALPTASGRGYPDVLPDGGPLPGRKAMGLHAALLGCRFVRAETATRTIIDPFCGWGTALAAANALGLDAEGVDLSARMCRRARRLIVTLEGASGHFGGLGVDGAVGDETDRRSGDAPEVTG